MDQFLEYITTWSKPFLSEQNFNQWSNLPTAKLVFHQSKMTATISGEADTVNVAPVLNQDKYFTECNLLYDIVKQ